MQICILSIPIKNEKKFLCSPYVTNSTLWSILHHNLNFSYILIFITNQILSNLILPYLHCVCSTAISLYIAAFKASLLVTIYSNSFLNSNRISKVRPFLPLKIYISAFLMPYTLHLIWKKWVIWGERGKESERKFAAIFSALSNLNLLM